MDLPAAIPLERAGPLLCAGITVYSPLKHFGGVAEALFKTKALNVGIAGLGGLGHMAVKIAKALGYKVRVPFVRVSGYLISMYGPPSFPQVTVISQSNRKRAAALEHGADIFVDR